MKPKSIFVLFLAFVLFYSVIFSIPGCSPSSWKWTDDDRRIMGDPAAFRNPEPSEPETCEMKLLKGRVKRLESLLRTEPTEEDWDRLNNPAKLPKKLSTGKSTIISE